MFDYIISGIVAVFLLVYLGWAMFNPRSFEACGPTSGEET